MLNPGIEKKQNATSKLQTKIFETLVRKGIPGHLTLKPAQLARKFH